jgi:RNA polymerase sigma factor (sigma-70 family)
LGKGALFKADRGFKKGVFFGEKMDFGALVEKVSPKLRAIAKKLNGKFTFFDEDDLYQEALVYLWQEYNAGGLWGKTNSFILQACYFFLRNHIRKIYKRVDRNSISLSQSITQANFSLEKVFSTGRVDQQIDSQEACLLIQDIQKKLTKRERDVFSMRLEGLTTRQMGQRLGLSHVMVVKIEKSIRKKCRKLKEEIF